MNEITIMENPRFGKVRKVMVNGEWYYVASDVAKSLEYSNPRDAILRHCRCVVKRDIPHPHSPSNVLRRTTMVTPKGQIYFLKHFCGKNYRLSKGEDLIQTTIEENLLPFEEDLSGNDEDLF